MSKIAGLLLVLLSGLLLGGTSEKPRIMEVTGIMSIPVETSSYPAHVTFRFGPKGILRLLPGQQLKIQGRLEAAKDQRIFELGDQAVVSGFESDFVSPKWWGAVGDGKINDTEAFQKAALFLQEKGGGHLLIPKGTYIVGGQFKDPRSHLPFLIQAKDVLYFTDLKNPLIIEGEKNSKVTLRLQPGLKFGSFNPRTGKPHTGKGRLSDINFANQIGAMIDISRSEKVLIKNLELDGNAESLVLGGAYGDHGRQLSAYGIRIYGVHDVTIQDVHTHHHGLDGILLGFPGLNKASRRHPQLVENVVSEYNARQGISIVGGNDITIRNSKFNHTGRGNFHSSPGAGIDIEAERALIRNVLLENVEVVNNVGVGIVAESGDSADILLKKSRVVGTTNWSLWLRRPRVQIIDSHITGSVVNLYSKEADAAQIKNTIFDDIDYIDSTGKNWGAFSRTAVIVQDHSGGDILFEGSTFIGSKGRPIWMDNGTIKNSTIVLQKADFKSGEFALLMRETNLENVTVKFEPLKTPESLSLPWYIASGSCENGPKVKRSKVQILASIKGVSYLNWCSARGRSGWIFP